MNGHHFHSVQPQVFKLCTVHRTQNPQLLELNHALREADFETVQQLLPCFQQVRADPTFTDIVHDHAEMYPIADAKYGSQMGRKTVFARSESVAMRSGAGEILPGRPWDWQPEQQKVLREDSRVLLKAHLIVGLRMRYEPLGHACARTKSNKPGGGWWLQRGELIEVTSIDRVLQGELEVRCVKLRGCPLATI